MYETGATWVITGPDNTTLVFNDGLSGLYLETVTGFDSPTVRANIEDLPESDGAVAGNAYYGSRPVTLAGKVTGSSAAQRNNIVVNMQRALRGLRGDVLLQSTPQGLPPMQATARLSSVRVTGGYVKDFLISLVCPDPRLYSQTLNVQAAQGATPTPGSAFPWVFPVNFGGGVGATLGVNVTNAGNFGTYPVVRVLGPSFAPQITNASTGESLYLDNLNLAAGDYVDVDFAARTVRKNDGTNQYSHVRFPGSVWFQLGPGSTTLQLWDSGANTSTTLQTSWRDSWL